MSATPSHAPRRSKSRRGPLTSPDQVGVDLSPRGGERGEASPVFAARRARECAVLTMSNSPSLHRSPDGAERNPGTNYQLHCPSRVSLPPSLCELRRTGRSTQATKLFTARFQAMKGSGTPAGAVVHGLYASGAQGAPRRRRLAPPSASARRLPAFHHGTCGGDRTPPLSSSSRTSWDGATEGRDYPPLPSPCGGRSEPAGRSSCRPGVWPGAARARG